MDGQLTSSVYAIQMLEGICDNKIKDKHVVITLQLTVYRKVVSQKNSESKNNYLHSTLHIKYLRFNHSAFLLAVRFR